MTDNEIRKMVEDEVKKALKGQEVDVVEVTLLSAGTSPKYTYVRNASEVPGSFLSGYLPNYHEQAQRMPMTELLTEILRGLEKLGLEIYHEPAKSAEFGIRKKPQTASDTQ